MEDDFKEMAAAGVTLLGEVGLGGVKTGDEAKKMVAWARKYGIQSTIHTGGPSIPGLRLDRQGRDPGGRSRCDRAISTAATPPSPTIKSAASARAASAGWKSSTTATNAPRSTPCARAREIGDLHRVILGTDAPGRLRRSAARDPAHGLDALLDRRGPGRDRALLRHRQHRAHAQARCAA